MIRFIMCASFCFMFCMNAMADARKDKAVGICAAYLTLAKNPSAIKVLEMADNEERALKFGREWIRTIDRRDSSIATLTSNADATCRSLGIAPENRYNSKNAPSASKPVPNRQKSLDENKQ